ncbi:MAG: hypothetical protein HC820_07745, partial [Hydrococcus sp. RM1_1_31]|nr:hypothetical protein [Hydrococcus sp. RM1_1_31]
LGEIKADLQVTGLLNQPQVSIDAISTKQTRIDRIDFRPGSTANIQVIGSDLSVTRFQAIPTVGGRLTGRGTIEFEETRGQGEKNSKYLFDLQANNVPAQAIARLYQTTIPVEIGLVSGVARFLGTLENLDKSKATGSANFRLGGGTVRASNFRYANGQWQGIVQTSGVSVASLNPSAPTQVGQGRVDSNLTVFGTLDSFKLDAMRATGSANIAIANGLVKARDLTLANGRWVSNVQAQGLVLDRLVPNVPSGAKGILNGTFNLAGRVDDVIDNLQGIGKGSLTLPKGAIAAEQIQLSQGKFQASLTPQNLALRQFSQELRGELAGKLDVFGTLENPNLKTVQASGELRFSEGIHAIAKPLTTVINWNGQRLGIERATADGINAVDGQILLLNC